jgi:hypothetical protein
LLSIVRELSQHGFPLSDSYVDNYTTVGAAAFDAMDAASRALGSESVRFLVAVARRPTGARPISALAVGGRNQS